MSLETKKEPTESIAEKFSKGEVVFKILNILPNGCMKDIGMVNTKEDYERKLYTHQYNPLLFICDIEIRLGYLYGCLNYQFNRSQEEEYLFMWRKIRTNEWTEWFRIKPYKEEIYKTVGIVHKG